MVEVKSYDQAALVEIQAQPKASEDSQLVPGRYLVELEPTFYYFLTDDERDSALKEWAEKLELEPGFYGRVTELLLVEPPNWISYARVFLVVEVSASDLPKNTLAPVLVWALVVAISALSVSVAGVALVLSVSATPDSWRRLGATFLLPFSDNETLEEIAGGEFDPGLGKDLLSVPGEVSRNFALGAAAVALVLLTRKN